jgi:hypothetical protein
LGCGSGKTIIQASETNLFDCIGGVEFDKELKDLCDRNLSKIHRMGGGVKNSFTILGNVEKPSWALEIKELLYKYNITAENLTAFIFNKNSYNAPILEESLKIINENFNSVIYLYQNPIHHKTLLRYNYELFLEDSKLNTAHKNYKYKCYIYEKV